MRVLHRLYTSEVPGFIKSMATDPPQGAIWKEATHEFIVMEHTGVAPMFAAVESLQAAGYAAFPAIRIGPIGSETFASYLDPVRWERLAKQLAEIRAASPLDVIKVHLECENFTGGGAEYYGDRAAIETAAKAFLDVLGKRGTGARRWHVLACPSDPRDTLMQAIAERVERFTLMDESSFAMATVYRDRTINQFVSMTLALHRKRVESLKVFEPLCQQVDWMAGLKAEFLTKAGSRFVTEALPAFGDNFWVFNDDKDALRYGYWPSAKWESNLTRSSLNDCSFFPLRGYAGYGSWCNDAPAFSEKWNEGEAAHAPARGVAPVADAYWPASERYLEHPTFGKLTSPFSLAFDVWLPSSGEWSLCGNWFTRGGNGGYKDWLLRINGANLVLDYVDGTAERSVEVQLLAAGWNRIVMSWDGGKFSFPNGVVALNAKPQVLGQPFRIGKGAVRVNGVWTPKFASELAFRDLMHRPRALTATELTAAKTGKYPWGL